MNEALRNATCLHVLDQGPTGEEGHKSTHGASFMQRAHENHLNTTGYVLGENIAYGSDDAKAALLTLAIDDGVAGRGHRKNIFREHFTQVGICNGKHKVLHHMAVLMYRGKTASEFGPDGKKDTASAQLQQKQNDEKEQADQEKNDEASGRVIMETGASAEK